MVEKAKHLLSLTTKALSFAQAGDFRNLEEIIDQRDEVFAQLSQNKNSELSKEQKDSVREAYLWVQQTDKEIVGFIEKEIKRYNLDMFDISTKLRVLKAYSKGFTDSARFDRIL